MSDTIELRIGADRANKTPGVKIDHFISYQVSADLYTPADAFHLEVANPEIQIKKGMLCELFINGQKELTGIIDKIQRRVSKSGVSLVIEGRDLMGLLIDFYCEQSHWKCVQGMKLKALAEMLLANVPFIQRKDIFYQENVAGKLKGKRHKSTSVSICDILDTAQKIGHIEPGMTIFEVLRSYSLSRGMLFYCEPDGTLVFGRPLAKGTPEYTLQMMKSGTGNNVIESDVTEDISRCYSKVIVVGQRQGNDSDTGASAINTTTGVNTDSTFPFYKLFVAKECNDNVSPAMRARIIMEKQRREGTQLLYTVGRHSQNGQNWQINKFAHIKDEVQSLNGVQGIDGNYLIYGRMFELTKQSGPITKLKLGEPGLIT